MMTSHRRRFRPEFKAQVALEALQGERTLNEIASAYDLHPNQLAQWKKQLLDQVPQIFSDKRLKQNKQQEEREDRLYRQIGQLQVELNWLKKKSGLGG
jgi:transposase-like protein